MLSLESEFIQHEFKIITMFESGWSTKQQKWKKVELFYYETSVLRLNTYII